MIHREDRDGIAVLRLEHGKANTLDVELCNAITEALDAASDARAIVLTGTGKILSAGVDLFRVLDAGAPYLAVFLPALARAFERLFVHPRPVITAANGHAIAGGCILVAAADLRLMAAGNARIGTPELQVGVPFPPIALEIMRFATAPQHLQTVLYQADTVEPPAALQRGLIDEIVALDDLIDHAMVRADRLASVPPETFSLTKRELRRPAMDRVRAAASEAAPEVDARWLAPETLEIIRSYLDRTIGKAR